MKTTPYRTNAERDSYNEDSKPMTTYQKFVSLMHTNSYTKSITGIGILAVPILLMITIGRIVLIFSPLVEGPDRHVVTDPLSIWIVSFCIGLLFTLVAFIMCSLIVNWKNITHFIVDEFFPKRDI